MTAQLTHETGAVKSITIALPFTTRVQLEALQTLLQIPTARVLEQAVSELLRSLPDEDRNLVESLASRARIVKNHLTSRANTVEDASVKQAATVTGKTFKYTGSLETGLIVHFANSNPIKISAESVQRIRDKISSLSPVLMGAIYSPLMPNSLGKAIKEEHQLTPITLSYVVPLLEHEKFCRTYKEGRNWIVEILSGQS
jgi:hypothetical protein